MNNNCCFCSNCKMVKEYLGEDNSHQQDYICKITNKPIDIDNLDMEMNCNSFELEE